MVTEFSRKIMSGVAPLDEDWNEFLRSAHGKAPSMTPAVFGVYTNARGQTSYEILAESAGPLEGKTVLDLACGDGFLFQFLLAQLGENGRLIGADMSEEELRVAVGNYEGDRRVSLYQTKAHVLPLENASVDAVFCHMAFMLMTPVEPVVQEIERVLKPGGKFCSVVGGFERAKGFIDELQSLKIDFIDSRYPAAREVRAGDPRAQSLAGLHELFLNGFSDAIHSEKIGLNIRTDADGVWEFMKDTYFISMLPEADQAQLQGEMRRYTETRLDGAGRISFEYPLQLFSVRKV
jgi:SAM-dependent methyltransferase